MLKDNDNSRAAVSNSASSSLPFTMDNNTESRKRPASDMNDKDENSNKRPYIPERRETTIFGVRPVDDIVQYVADFIAAHCDQENVEVSVLFYFSL